MVSTRGVKVKFSEGERVLCYEPDPTKAKVLYDSKVLEVVYNKDTKGRKQQVEYLIHFQGWNASWDRCVAEDFVLKDTDENRELQRQLADKAHIKLSIKSNRVLLWGPSSSKEKRRKRRLSETIRETIEKEKKEREESETSSQTGTTITDEDMGSGCSEAESNATGLGEEEEGEEEEEEEVIEEDETSDEETFEKHFPIVIPENLKSVLERDYFFINEKEKLLDLPTHRTALNLLESYVRFFAVRYLPRTKERRRSEVKEKDKTFLTLDLCKEVMDGIRICFDFHIETHLLYSKELKQAEKLRNAKPIVIKGEPDIAQDILLPSDEHENEASLSSKEEMDGEDNKLKLEKICKEEEKMKAEVTGRRQLRSKRPLSGESSSTTEREKNPAPQTCESGRSTPTTITSGTSTAGISGLGGSDLTCVPLYHTVQPQLQDWTLLPDTNRDPPPPSLIYGPLHLIRLFVKFPEILYRMNLPELKRRIILKHLELFLEYVSNHSEELFPESHYLPNPYL